ncbi:MAG TPA: VWA domain-containing protein [Pyrinomonadaceae bacterium]|jgi:VWFA-related protein
MLSCNTRQRTRLILLLLCLSAAGGARAQGQQEPAPPPDEIIRVSTELVQTDVLVLDKQGKFVPNLRAEDFELRVDGKPQTIAFFERIHAGSLNEEAQLAAARGGRDRAANDTGGGAVRPLDRGRLIFFFIDDLHLAPSSLVRTRDLLLQFIEKQLRQNDQVAIVATSGQTGFLQQLTDDQEVLRAAIQRLTYRELTARDMSSPPMTAMDALSIERNDTTVVSAFVDATMREIPAVGRPGGNNSGIAGGGPNNLSARNVAESQVRARAAQLMQQVTAVATQTLGSLQSLLRTTAQLPGRKLVYFISDGFVLNTGQGEVLDRLRRVTDAAVRAGVVVYTLDARGLSAAIPGVPDASGGRTIDPTGRLALSTGNENTALQEPLRVIAGDTGGRAMLNTNALKDALTQALEETSVYYLLAWRPAQDEMRGGRFRRIDVEVKSRPELSVLVQRGFFTTPPPDEQPRKRDEAKREKRPPAAAGTLTGNASTTTLAPPEAALPHPSLLTALRAYAPRTALPTALTLNYFNTQQHGLLLASSLQVAVEPPPPGQNRHVDLIGAIYNAQGDPTSSFERHITVTPKQPGDAAAPATAQPGTPEAQRIVITHQIKITPGIYQVRIASREVETGHTGSATQWITIPALDGGKLAMSSIFLGERPRVETSTDPAAPSAALVNPDRHFSRASVLRFILYIYNAARAGQTTPPDVALQLQVFRDDQPVITTPLRKVQVEGLTDFSVLPYAAELNLSDLPAGHYVLRAAAIDRTAKTSALQHVKFTVD